MERSSCVTATVERPSFCSFKLQLLSFLSQFQELRENERRAKEELHISNQLRKQNEVDMGEKIRELREELGACQESNRKLQGTVQYLQNDNAIQDMKIQELKGTVENLIQSREIFIKHYEDSTCELRHSIETKDRKLSALSQMLQSHIRLFGSLEKEALALKQTLGTTEHIVFEKEQVVAELIRKMDLSAGYEEQFSKKIVLLENKLKTSQDELQRKSIIIVKLQEGIRDAKDHGNCIAQIEELRRTVSLKEMMIQNLVSEKQALQLVVEALEDNLQRILPHVIAVPEWNSSSVELDVQPSMKLVANDKDERIKDECQEEMEHVQNENEHTTADESERSSVRSPQNDRITAEASKLELVCSSPPSTYSESAANAVGTSPAGSKGKSGSDLVHQLNPESLVTGDGISEDLK